MHPIGPISLYLSATAFLLAGCRTAPEPVSVEAQLAMAAGEPIVFRSDPGPLDAPDPHPATLELPEVIRRVVRHDPRIQRAISRVRMAEADLKQAQLLPNPVLDLAFRFPQGGGKPLIEAGLATELVAILQQPGRVSAADSRLRAEAANALGTLLEVLSEARSGYAAIQALDELVSIQHDRRQLIDRLLDLARARLRAGEATQLDVTTLQTQRVELETQAADTELERRQARLKLARLIGQPSADPAWRVSRWAAPPEPGLSEPQWIHLALAKHPQILARTYELKALGVDRDLARLAPLDTTTLGIASERDDLWTAGPAISVPLPIFDMGQATRARATAAVIEARYSLQAAQRESMEGVRIAYANYQASRQNLSRVKNELIPLQERRLAQAEAQYRTGQTDLTTLFLAEQDLRAARARLIELQRRTSDALIQLEKAAGGPVRVDQEKPGAAHGPTTGPTH